MPTLAAWRASDRRGTWERGGGGTKIQQLFIGKVCYIEQSIGIATYTQLSFIGKLFVRTKHRYSCDVRVCYMIQLEQSIWHTP